VTADAVLPSWEVGTVGVLSLGDTHSIPISTAVRAGDDRLLFALGSRRETLAKLREDPAASMCLLGEGLAFTARGTATVIREPLECADHVAALVLRVERIQDHLADGRTEMLAGARFRRPDAEVAQADAAIVTELGQIADE
jgi:hypothetical protein